MADGYDLILMFIGSLGAMATGVSLPVFNILFGDLMDGLNSGASFTSRVNRVCGIFGIVSALNILTGLMQVCSFYNCNKL
jgi:hypothetical protein